MRLGRRLPKRRETCSASTALQACRRLEPRLSEWVFARHGRFDPPATIDAASARAVAMPAATLVAAAGLAGAAWHGNAIRRLVVGGDVRALVEAIGPDAHAFALRHGAAAAAEPPEGVAALIEAIGRDGYRCLAAWCAGRPAAIASLVLLKLPPGTLADQPVDQAFADRGPAVFDLALTELACDADA